MLYILSHRSTLVAGLVLTLSAIARAGSPVQWDGPITDIDGRVGPQYAGMGTTNVQLRYRPLAADQTSLNLNNLRIHDVANQKAIDIGVTTNPDGSLYYYKNINVNHYEGYNINRDEATWGALHIDYLRIAGGGNHQTDPTNVSLNDVYLHDGDALPVIMEDGWFGTITLKNVRIENTSLGMVQLMTEHTGRIDHIIVEDSPGLHVLTETQPGNSPAVDIINSPGASVSGPVNMGTTTPDTLGTGLNAGSAVPEPATLGLLGGAGLLALRRRRTATRAA